MSEALLIANNLSSAVVVLSCWWLAHINARAQPPGRAIAAAYSALGFLVLLTMVVRNLGVELRPVLPWMIVGTKSILSAALLLTIYRRIKLGDR